MSVALTSPIIGIENRTPQEVFDIMCDRIRALLDRLEAAERQVKELREANRKLHRRAQIAEAFMRSAEDIPNGWLNVLKNQVSRQDIVQRTIVDEIVKAKERARAALEAAPAGEVGWRTMESAPRDGTHVDLWVNGERYADCRWDGEADHWWVKYSETADNSWPLDGEPTHWMPLPPSPTGGDKP